MKKILLKLFTILLLTNCFNLKAFDLNNKVKNTKIETNSFYQKSKSFITKHKKAVAVVSGISIIIPSILFLSKNKSEKIKPRNVRFDKIEIIDEPVPESEINI